MENTKSVNRQFKLLSAIAMIAVVAGHCGNAGIGGLFTWFQAYSWHLPLFIFISGYFYKNPGRGGYGLYIWKKVKRLLIPLFIYNLVYGAIGNIIKFKGFSLAQPISLKTLFYSPLVYGHQFRFDCPLWYVIPIFLCYLCYPWIKKLFGERKYSDELLLAVLCALFLVTFRYDKIPFFSIPNDLKVFLSRLFLFLPFFQLGHMFKTRYENVLNAFSGRAVILINIIVCFILLWAMPTHSLSYSLCWQNDFDNKFGVLILLGSINGIVFLYEVTKVLIRHISLKYDRYYMVIADNTYDIMANQLFGFFILNTIIAVVSKLRGGFAAVAFDWISYKSDVYYIYTPFNQFKILYLVFGIAVSLLVVWVKNKVVIRVCHK